MNFYKSIMTLGIVSAIFTGCKDTGAKPAIDASKETATVAHKAPAVAAKPETTSFKIDGMTCAMGCAKTIEDKLSHMDGVQKATVDFDKKEAVVEFDAAVLTPQQLVETVEKTGDGATYKVSGVETK